MIYLPDAENRTIISSFFRTKHQNVTDRRTDRRTACGYYGGLHCDQCRGLQTRCKNRKVSVVRKERRLAAAIRIMFDH